jgi:hypothetical protein
MVPYKKLSPVFLVALLLSSLLSVGTQSAQAAIRQSTANEVAQGSCEKVTVMTRNMYPGTDFADILAAQDLPTLFAEVGPRPSLRFRPVTRNHESRPSHTRSLPLSLA